jgi:hypothetical protein
MVNGKREQFAPYVRPTISLQEKREGVVGLSFTPTDYVRLRKVRGNHLFKMPDATLALQIFRIGLDCVEDLQVKHEVSSALRPPQQQTKKGKK